MAGLGFKDFQVGEVLTSADVDGYLMQQSVMRFADAAARGSALGTAVGTAVPLAEGMVSYLDDSDRVMAFAAGGWTQVGALVGGTAINRSGLITATTTTVIDTISYTPLSPDNFLCVSIHHSITPARLASNPRERSCAYQILQKNDSAAFVVQQQMGVGLYLIAASSADAEVTVPAYTYMWRKASQPNYTAATQEFQARVVPNTNNQVLIGGSDQYIQVLEFNLDGMDGTP